MCIGKPMSRNRNLTQIKTMQHCRETLTTAADEFVRRYSLPANDKGRLIDAALKKLKKKTGGR